jgi:hypothetical protein
MNLFKAQHTWLKNRGSDKATLFFAGWGLTPSLWAHLETGDSDVLVFYDYGHVSDVPDLSAYKKVAIIGYSMGVLMATAFCNENRDLPITHLVAFCGSALPVSAQFGLDPLEYEYFIENMSATMYKEFLFKVAGDIAQYRQIAPKALPFQKEHMSQSLAYILSVQEKSLPVLRWNKAIVCKHDLVFAADKLLNYWSEMQLQPILLEKSHFPFYTWHQWEDLLLLIENNS